MREQDCIKYSTLNKCFWASDIAEGKLKISEICLGENCPEVLVKKFEDVFGSDVYMNDWPIIGGTGEPYVKIYREDLYNMMDYTEYYRMLTREIFGNNSIFPQR